MDTLFQNSTIWRGKETDNLKPHITNQSMLVHYVTEDDCAGRNKLNMQIGNLQQ